jgi:hypothetical protein
MGSFFRRLLLAVVWIVLFSLVVMIGNEMYPRTPVLHQLAQIVSRFWLVICNWWVQPMNGGVVESRLDGILYILILIYIIGVPFGGWRWPLGRGNAPHR